MLRMKVAVFAPIDRKDAFLLRVVVVREGSGVMNREANERLMIESFMAVVMDGSPICICIEEMSSSFSSRHNYVEMDLSINSSHSFQIKRIDDNEPFSARLVLLQKRTSSSPLLLSLSFDAHYDQLVVNDDSLVSVDFRLPHQVKQRIATILDLPSERDWVSLARSLGASSFVAFGRNLSSPTTVLLTLWEARMEEPCILAHALRLSGRPEVAQIIDKFLL